MPSTELTNVSLAKMKLLTRSAVLVRNVGNRLRMEATIPNCEVISTSKHRHGGGKIDRWWEQQAVKSMSMCEHRSQIPNNGGLFPCSICLLSLNLVLRQVHYLKNGNAARHEQMEILHWCHMKILCGKKSRWAAETMYSRRCEKGWYWAHVTNRLWLISWQLFVHHVTTILILESWVWNGDLANRIVLKRSVFTVSLPTPPRTYRRFERGCSHGNCDSKSADLGNQGSALSSTDEEDT